MAFVEQLPDQPPCHRCGYDVRAQALDGACPECGEPVAESRRLAAKARRVPWRDRDPRWRRRVLAGVWVLVLVPLMDALRASGLASHVPVPNLLLTSSAPDRTLKDTLICWPGLYQPLVFCMGIVLLFAKEQSRRPGRLDWTRRWGVLCSYVVLLLSAADFLLLVALVTSGIAASFLYLPPSNQPAATQFLVKVSSGYLRYGPSPEFGAAVARDAFSSIAVLLACVPLFDALRSSGRAWLAAMLLVPLSLFALIQLVPVAQYGLNPSGPTMDNLFKFGIYFRPTALVSVIADPAEGWGRQPPLMATVIEAVKWCAVVAIALWLTLAQLKARRRREPAMAAE